MSTTSSSAPDGSDALSNESQSGMVMIVSAILTGLSTIVVLLRLYTRQFILKAAGADDWTMALAQLMSITAGISTIMEAHYGLGRHVATLSVENIHGALSCLFATILSYNIGMNIIKVSFLLQYCRIFPSRTLRIICLWGLGVIGIWTVIQGVLLSITCTPLSELQPSTASWCLDTLAIWEFSSVVGLITDFTIFLLPAPSIWKLPIAPRQRILLFSIFGLGFFVCIVSIIRIPTLRAASMAADPTWDNVAAGLWTLTEINLAILCSSLPVLRPLFFKASGRGSRKTITGGDPNDPSKQNSRSRALELTSTSRRKTMRTVVTGPNDSSDELVHSTIDEMIYGPGEPGARPGAGYNTALADENPAELGLVQGQSAKTWIRSDKRDG